MASPAFGTAGAAVASTGNTLNVAYPSGIQAGDFLCLLALTKSNIEINTPAGWSQHPTAFRNQGAGNRAEWFWKRAVGNESGTLAVTRVSGTVLFFARMYRFSGIPDGSADPFEAAAQTGLTASATITPADLTTLGRDRRVVCLLTVGDDNAVGNLTGGTATVPEDVAEAITLTGTDGCLSCLSAARSMPELFDFGTFVMAVADPVVAFTFALLPSAEPLQRASAPNLSLDVKRHPITQEVKAIAWQNTSGFPATLTLWKSGSSESHEVAGSETTEVSTGAGYIWDEASAGLNVNIRYQ